MNNVHLVSGPPAAFVKSINDLVTECDVALSIVSVTAARGRLVAVVEETGGSKNTRGALIEVACLGHHPQEQLAGLAAENPLWSVVSAFDFAAPKKAAADEQEASGIMVLAALRQP